MKVLELFAGTRSVSRAFEQRGHETYSVEWNKDFEGISLYADISTLTAQQIIELCGGVPDVIWASPDCFVKGTLVWTDRGYVPIEEIKCKDRVLTHKGQYKKVYRTIKKNTRKFTKLKISGIEEMLVTPNHPFYARKKVSKSKWEKTKAVHISYMESPEWVNAEDLTTEYRIGIPINTNAIIPEWDGSIREYRNAYGPTRCELINELSKVMDSPDFWWIVGNYFADGSFTKNGVDISYGIKEEDRNEIIKHLNALNWEYYEYSKETCNHIEINGKELHDFLLQFGKGALNKEITPAILDLPIPLLTAFLEGYFRGDGHIDRSTENPQMRYSTVSRKLAYGLTLCILKAYRRYPNITTRTPPDTIQGRKVNVHKCYSLSYYLNDSDRFQYVIEDNMAWVNVRSVEQVNTEQQSIYTLSVEDDESYTVFNLAVHNCTSYSVMAISKHRERERDGTLTPKSEYAKFCDMTNSHVIDLIKELKPKLYFIENPVGALRKMPFMKDIPRYTVTYCQYGDFRQKPTDIWTNHPNPDFKPMCKRGAPCHMSAPRGSKSGTQLIKGARDRARLPDLLCQHIVDISEDYIGKIDD